MWFRYSSLPFNLMSLLWLACAPAALCYGEQAPAQGKSNDPLHKASLLWDSGQQDLAIRGLEEFLDSDAGHSAAAQYRSAVYRELGRFYLGRGNRERAAAALESSLKLDATDGSTHYQLGVLYLGGGRLPEGISELEQAVLHGFRNLGVFFNLFEAYFAAGRTTDALEQFEKIITLNFSSGDIPLRLGQLLFDHLYYNQAGQAFRAALNRNQASYEARFFLALTSFLLEQFEETTQLLSPLASENPTVEVLNLLGCTRAKLARFEEAVEPLKEAIQKAPGRPDSYFNLALVYLEMERLEEAEALLQTARTLQSDRGIKVFYNLSRNSCARLEKEIEGQHAPEEDSARVSYYYDLALQFQGRYYHNTAVELLRLSRRYGKDTPELLFAAGLSCLNLEPLSSSAASMLRKSVDLKPDFADAYYLLGRTYSQQEKAEEAWKAYQKAIELKPDVSAYHYELGKILAGRISPDGEIQLAHAIDSLEEAIRLDPKHAPSHYELGKIYMRLMRYGETLLHLEKSVRLEPEFYEPYYLLGRLYAKIDQPEKASQCFEAFDKRRWSASQRATVKGGFVTAAR